MAIKIQKKIMRLTPVVNEWAASALLKLLLLWSRSYIQVRLLARFSMVGVDPLIEARATSLREKPRGALRLGSVMTIDIHSLNAFSTTLLIFISHEENV